MTKPAYRHVTNRTQITYSNKELFNEKKCTFSWWMLPFTRTEFMVRADEETVRMLKSKEGQRRVSELTSVTEYRKPAPDVVDDERELETRPEAKKRVDDEV